MATGKKSEPKVALQKLSRGGETFDVEKSATMFVAKRAKPDTSTGLAMGDPESFAQLNVRRCPGRQQLELCRISVGSIDDTMQTLRQDKSRISWVGHVYHMPNDPDGLMIPSDAIYVELADGASESEVNDLLDRYGLELVPDPNSAANAYIMRLTSASTKNPLKIANELLESDAVAVAEPDLIAIANPAHRPSDTLYPQQWHLENSGGFGLTAGADVRAPQAWDISRGDRAIIVAVIDDGFDTGHPDFSSPGKIVAPADFGQDDVDPNPVSSRDNHGTACAGVAVADENGTGVVGLAPNCKLMPVRWSGSVSDGDIREQFNHASNNGADVISCSWGVSSSFFTLSTSMKRSIQNAATGGRDGKGCVIVFAAGNANHDIDDVAGGTRAGFAIHPDVIAVAASNSRDRKSHYSNFGDAIWICAPSSGQGGLGIVTTDRRGNFGYQAGDYTTVERFGGTSSSTPLVAGLCGLILSVNPDLTAEEVKEILKLTAQQIDDAGGGTFPALRLRSGRRSGRVARGEESAAGCA
jgi:subtilisin family serine protease